MKIKVTITKTKQFKIKSQKWYGWQGRPTLWQRWPTGTQGPEGSSLFTVTKVILGSWFFIHTFLQFSDKKNLFAIFFYKASKKTLISGFEERLWNCSWTVSEEHSLEACLPQAQGFHRDYTQLKMLMKKYYHEDEKRIPGTLASNKHKYHHNKVTLNWKFYLQLWNSNINPPGWQEGKGLLRVLGSCGVYHWSSPS